jgi:hypothetical protein
MIGNEVADNLHPHVVSLIEQALIVLPRTEVRINVVKIQGMIPVIVGRLENGREHNGIETQILDIVKFVDDSLQVAPAEHVLTLWRHLPPSVESVNQQMIDSDVVKPVLHIVL